MAKQYRTVKLPAKMLEAVEQLVKDHPEYGYSSIADFVKDAVRHHKTCKTSSNHYIRSDLLKECEKV